VRYVVQKEHRTLAERGAERADDLPHHSAPRDRVQIGSAVIEFPEEPHTGWAKFSGRFGNDALKFVNSQTGRELRLRGANCRVVVAARYAPATRSGSCRTKPGLSRCASQESNLRRLGRESRATDRDLGQPAEYRKVGPLASDRIRNTVNSVSRNP
jgi:hypothetical protein